MVILTYVEIGDEKLLMCVVHYLVIKEQFLSSKIVCSVAGRVGNLALFSCCNGGSGQVLPRRGLRTVATAPQCGRPPECARQDGAKLTTSLGNTSGRDNSPTGLGYSCGFIAYCEQCKAVDRTAVLPHVPIWICTGYIKLSMCQHEARMVSKCSCFIGREGLLSCFQEHTIDPCSVPHESSLHLSTPCPSDLV